MLQKLSTSTPLDKNGIWKVKLFHIYRGFKVKTATTNTFIKISVKKTKPNNWIKKGFKSKAIIIFLKNLIVYSDGFLIKFKINSSILLKKRLTPRGKEIFGPSLFIIKRKKFINSFVNIL